MRDSSVVREAWLDFCEGISKGQVERFDDLVSEDAHLIIGTAPGEMITERSKMRFGFETEGVTLESRKPKRSRRALWDGSSTSPGLGFPTGAVSIAV